MKTCSLWYCREEHYAKGYCYRHYQQQRRTGEAIGGEVELVLSTANLAKHIISILIREEEDDEMRKLMKVFLDTVSGEGKDFTCPSCGKETTLVTDGKSTAFWSCGCDRPTTFD